jgi:putative tricarboxylic transport membrane protein
MVQPAGIITRTGNIMITRDMIGGLVAAIFATVYLHYATKIRVSSLSDSFGPQGMPLVYGWLMLGLGLVLIGQGVFAYLKSDAGTRQFVDMADWAGQGRKTAWAAGLMAFGVAYLGLVNTLGYLLAMAVLICGVALFLGARFSWRPVLIGVLGAVVLWLIFVKLLGVAMPAGLLAVFGL